MSLTASTSGCCAAFNEAGVSGLNRKTGEAGGFGGAWSNNRGRQHRRRVGGRRRGAHGFVVSAVLAPPPRSKTPAASSPSGRAPSPARSPTPALQLQTDSKLNGFNGTMVLGGAGKEDALTQLDLDRGLCVTFRKYSPQLVRDRVLSSPLAALQVLARGTQMCTTLAGFFSRLWLDELTGRDAINVQLRSAQLRQMLVKLGPSFIKAGQVLANRPDIIRDDYMNELCRLQDDVPAFPSRQAYEIIEESLGRPISSVFAYISPEPVAAASLGQVYKGRIRDDSPVAPGADVAIKVQRPGIEPIIYMDLFLFRTLAQLVNSYSMKHLGCNAQLIVDEFGEKLLEELDYVQEARNMLDFYGNFKNDPYVKIPMCYRELTGPQVLVMEWIDGVKLTDIASIKSEGIDIPRFITVGVSSALRQLLEFGLFHGDPHPGNLFAMRDGRIAYVDFGNVAELSQLNKQILIDAVVHAVNEDYVEMAGDFSRLGFLAPGTDITPIVPALEKIWQDSTGKSMADFNFRTVTDKFNKLVFQYPIRIPERFALVIRSLLTQEGICLTLQPNFKFLEVAYPYVAKRLLTDPDPALRDRLLQVLFRNGSFQWARLENLIKLAKEGVGGTLDLTGTVKDGALVVLRDEGLRQQLIRAFTEGERLHIGEVTHLLGTVSSDLQPQRLVQDMIRDLPNIGRDFLLSWSERVLSDR
eukprot:jgi/Chlat1/4634/Chrsp3S05594